MDEVKPVARVPTVEHREPCESRGSRTVLGAPGGEIPPGELDKGEFLRFRTMSANAYADIAVCHSITSSARNRSEVGIVGLIIRDYGGVTRARRSCPAFWSRNRWRHAARAIVLQAARWRG